MEEPLIVKDDSTVQHICNKLHRDFVRKFRYARVKGPSAKFDWQRVGLDHLLKDGDVLTIVVRSDNQSQIPISIRRIFSSVDFWDPTVASKPN